MQNYYKEMDAIEKILSNNYELYHYTSQFISNNIPPIDKHDDILYNLKIEKEQEEEANYYLEQEQWPPVIEIEEQDIIDSDNDSESSESSSEDEYYNEYDEDYY